VSCLGESGMDLAVRSPRCKTELEQFLTTNPVYACAERTSGMYRPRLYWTSWQVSSYANAPLQFNKTVGHMELLFKEDRRAAHDLEREGLRRGDGNPLAGLASAARCQPRKRPSSRPSDLSQYSAADLKRYAAGKYAYPLDHYCLNNMVQESTKAPRPLNSAEREWFLGFPIAHTEKCWSRHKRDTAKAAWEAERCTLLGTALACPIVAYLVSDWAYQNRLASTVPCMKSVLDRTGPMFMQGVYSRYAQRKAVTEFEMKKIQEDREGLPTPLAPRHGATFRHAAFRTARRVADWSCANTSLQLERGLGLQVESSDNDSVGTSCCAVCHEMARTTVRASWQPFPASR
jgi:hypothetical protein